MKNLFNRFKKEKTESQEASSFDWNEWFQSKSTVIYMPERLSTEAILSAIKQAIGDYFHTEEIQETALDGSLVFIVEQNSKLKSLMKLNTVFHLYVHPQSGLWSFALAASESVTTEQIEEWPEPKEISAMSGVSQSALLEKIEAYLADLLLAHYPPMQEGAKNHLQAYIPPAGRYVETIKNSHWLWQMSFIAPEEPLIAWLGISSLKKSPEPALLDNLKNHDLYYWATDARKGIVGFNKHSQLASIIGLSAEVLEVKAVVGRDEASQGGWEWLTNLSNDLEYVEAQEFINISDSNQRLRTCARLNWLKDSKDKPSDDYAFTLLRRLASIDNDPFDDLTLMCMSLTDKKRQVIIHQENTDEELLHQIHQALMAHDGDRNLAQWVEQWQISPESASSILSAFLALQSDTSSHLLSLHQWVRTAFLKKQPALKKHDKWDKALLQRLNFEFEYLQHLLTCQKHEEALILAEELLAHLPEETPQELIAELELEESARRQTYRIQLLDFIVQARDGASEEIKELRHLATLEPLRLPRLKALAAAAEGLLKERTMACMEMLTSGSFIGSPYMAGQLPKAPIKNESLKQIKSIVSSGFVSKMQSWVATVRLPDLNQVRSYNEQVAPHNDGTQLLKKMATVQMALKMPPVECYITRGEKAGEVRAYGGLDPFMLIGHHLLDKNSPRHIGEAEQLFLLATEMTHIKLKHAKITSSDVWRGSLEKGAFAAQLLPVLGDALKALSIPSIKVPLSPIMDRGSKTMRKIENTGLLNYAKEHLDSYVGDAPQASNDGEKLLEVSQYMQFVADRIGLVICGNIQAAIRAIFHNSDKYFKNVPFVAEFGISRLAQQEDTEGQTANRLLNLRIASLLSFYLSETYAQARLEVMGGD